MRDPSGKEDMHNKRHLHHSMSFLIASVILFRQWWRGWQNDLLCLSWCLILCSWERSTQELLAVKDFSCHYTFKPSQFQSAFCCWKLQTTQHYTAWNIINIKQCMSHWLALHPFWVDLFPTDKPLRFHIWRLHCRFLLLYQSQYKFMMTDEEGVDWIFHSVDDEGKQTWNDIGNIIWVRNLMLCESLSCCWCEIWLRYHVMSHIYLLSWK